MPELPRRSFLALSAAAMAGCAAPGSAGASGSGKWRFAINPSTIRGFKLTLKEQVRLAIAAGYQGIEPWLADVAAAREKGELRDIRKMCEDAGFSVVNGIGFARWSLPDAAARARGLEEMKRDMGYMAELGCGVIAAPPFGLQKPGSPHVSLDDFAERYAVVCDLGAKMGVMPVLEFWGHSVNLSRLAEALYVVAAAGRGNSGILADVYHMHRGGSPYEGLRQLSPATFPVLHMNDFPSTPVASALVDGDRVMPGDGVAPWKKIFALLREGNLSPWLSLEIFNRDWWQGTPERTLAAGLAAMKRVAG